MTMFRFGLVGLFVFCFSYMAVAHAQYKPATTIVRDVTTIHVNKDGASTQSTESTVRIETQQGVQSSSEQRISYVSTLEDLQILEAHSNKEAP